VSLNVARKLKNISLIADSPMHLGNYIARGRGGFTRTDLSFCAGAFLLLMLMIVASHGGARSRVFQTVDVSNHGRISKATALFAADHSDSLPNIGWGLESTCWAHAAFLPNGGAASLAQFETVYSRQLAYVTNGQLFPYIRDSHVYMCPADRPDSPVFWQRTIYITSYVWNGSGNGFGHTNSYKLSQFRPDAILEWEADDQFPFFFNDCSMFPDEGLSARHSLETWVAQYDGSVGTIVTSNWFSNAFAGARDQRGMSIPTSLLPNRLWCNPGTTTGR